MISGYQPNYNGPEWLTPSQGVALIVPRLSTKTDVRAIELILDHASEGRLNSKAHSVCRVSCSGTVEEQDCAISSTLWREIRDGSTYASWDTGDFDATAHIVNHGWVTTTVRGARFSRMDIHNLVPFIAAEPYAADRPVNPPMPLQAWSEAQMIKAIADCPIGNRERAWEQYFKPRLSMHGWTNDAFRHLWAKARGSEGRTGRPPRRQG